MKKLGWFFAGLFFVLLVISLTEDYLSERNRKSAIGQAYADGREAALQDAALKPRERGEAPVCVEITKVDPKDMVQAAKVPSDDEPPPNMRIDGRLFPYKRQLEVVQAGHVIRTYKIRGPVDVDMGARRHVFTDDMTGKRVVLLDVGTILSSLPSEPKTPLVARLVPCFCDISGIHCPGDKCDCGCNKGKPAVRDIETPKE